MSHKQVATTYHPRSKRLWIWWDARLSWCLGFHRGRLLKLKVDAADNIPGNTCQYQYLSISAISEMFILLERGWCSFHVIPVFSTGLVLSRRDQLSGVENDIASIFIWGFALFGCRGGVWASWTARGAMYSVRLRIAKATSKGSRKWFSVFSVKFRALIMITMRYHDHESWRFF